MVTPSSPEGPWEGEGYGMNGFSRTSMFLTEGEPEASCGERVGKICEREKGFVSFTLTSLDPRVPGKAESLSASHSCFLQGLERSWQVLGGAQPEATGMI